MKKKRSNAEHRTPNIEWIGDRRVREDSPDYRSNSTLNAQRSTPNPPKNGSDVADAQRQKDARFDLEDRPLEFSARVIRLVDALPNTRAANHLAGQLLRCGTSPYGNHGEVEAAESRKDFIHKLKICLKGLRETRRWLRLAAKSTMAPVPKMVAILRETEELIKIFFSSIRTAEKNTE